MNTRTSDLPLDIAQSYASGFSARLYVGPEEYQYQVAAETAKSILRDTYDMEVEVISWNRLCGFYGSEPDTVPPKDKVTNKPEVALNLLIKDTKGLAKVFAGGAIPQLDMPFDLKKNLIVLVREFDAVLASQGYNSQLITLIRTYINGNMGNAGSKSDRGRRMLVFLSCNTDVGQFLPELSPVVVSLPGAETSRQAIDNVLNGPIRDHEENPTEGMVRPSDDEYQTLVNTLTGMPYQDREDAISKALTVHRNAIKKAHSITPLLAALIETIEGEKARFIQGKPGLSYVSKADLPTNDLPGYGAVDDWVNKTIHINAAKARAHNLPPARGILLVGPPGTGKTAFSKSLAAKSGRMLLTLNPGEIQGSLVGQSENNMRSALDIIRAIKPVVLVDEIDKGGMAAIQGGHQGDGGVFSRMIAMLLIEMSDPMNEAIWVLAANRLVSCDGTILLPAPLIRAGRIDERYWVELPDAPIRLAILQAHMSKHKIRADKQAGLEALADATDNWVGAELADLVVRATRKAIHEDQDVLNTEWMSEFSGKMTPQAAQPAFLEELRANRQACERFTVVGRSGKHTVGARVTKAPARAERATSITIGS